jgi:fluoride exporter
MSGAELWAAIAVLGGLGAVARYGVDRAIERRTSTLFPAGTLAVNASGALLLGVLAGRGVGGDGLLLAGTAVLGSYTTFSTWMFETMRLAEDGEEVVALANLALGLAAGLAAASLGWGLGAVL